MYEVIMKNILSFANKKNDIAAVLLLGSRARMDKPADAYSDADVMLVVSDPEVYLESNDWLKRIGYVWFGFTEETFGEGKERRVLFDGALDVDFLLFSQEQFSRLLGGKTIPPIFSRGYHVLLDKCQITDKLQALPCDKIRVEKPEKEAFINLIQDFFFHTVWVSKKLLRGELWMAKNCIDGYMKQLVLQMIEWHARARHGLEYDTWHQGRFLDSWADTDVMVGVKRSFAHYDREDMIRALFATTDLFRTLAREASQKLQIPYPNSADEKATEWVHQAFSLKNP